MHPLLSMNGITKSFPGVIALQNVNFELEEGEVHALLGENGAGKSTLMKILSGVYKPDSGSILLDGKRLSASGPRTMLNAGVSIIYQELNLVTHMSVAENIFLGREPLNATGLIDKETMQKNAKSLLLQFKLDFDTNARVHTLSPAYQQVVEIAKALSLKSRILVMDEPTASLTGHEIDQLFDIIRRLRSNGVSVVYISHRLEEIWKVADRVTILRDGQKILTSPLSELTISEIIRNMVGRDLTEQYPKLKVEIKEEVLCVDGLAKIGVCDGVSFRVRRGEILGLAGLVGAGRTEIMQLIFGYCIKDKGSIKINNRKVEIRSTRDAVRNGIAYIPEERKKQGLVLGLSVFDNISLANLDRNSLFGWLRKRALFDLITSIVKNIGVKTPSIHQLVDNLSGGNQQKVVLSKWFVRNCQIYIFDEPTRGIDVGAKVEIYRLMQTLVQRGAAVILISSDLTEVLNMSDRVMVVYRGQIMKEFEREKVTQEEVMHYALGFAEETLEKEIK